MQQAREQVRAELEQAGFTAVQVLDTAFLVGAVGPNGEPIMVVVNPPPMAGQSGSGQSGPAADAKGLTSDPVWRADAPGS